MSRRYPFVAVYMLATRRNGPLYIGATNDLNRRVYEHQAELAGSINPMLARHGEASEARQYSGRRVPDNWKCPYEDKRST